MLHKEPLKLTTGIHLRKEVPLIRFFRNKDFRQISPEEINQSILGLIRQRDISSSQQNQWINSIKFYYEKVLGREKQL
jgi:hypothetical protein